MEIIKIIHKLKSLPYAYDALEPYIDEQTMRIHIKHHQAYIDKLKIYIRKTLIIIGLADIG
jgi:superoxide dismutase